MTYSTDDIKIVIIMQRSVPFYWNDLEAQLFSIFLVFSKEDMNLTLNAIWIPLKVLGRAGMKGS